MDILTAMTLLPLLSGLLLLLFAREAPTANREAVDSAVRNICFAISLIVFVAASMLAVESYTSISWSTLAFGDYALQNDCTDGSCSLIAAAGVHWKVGIDALSFPMVWLTALLIPISMLVEWDQKQGAYFHPLLLLMEGALLGVFVVLDLFMFYVFWELTLIPMFFLILMWGGEDRRYAAMKFFIYTFTASVLMLVGILLMYFHTPDITGISGTLTGHHFNIPLMATQSGFMAAEGLRALTFLLLLIGFATKMPSAPFHTWLPDAHVQAPTAGSMILAGVMLKMGAYGFLRLAVSIFPDQTVAFVPLLVFLGMFSLVYGAWVCLGQTNLKRMVAYSSVSHMGLIFLGIATMQPLGIAGAIFMMFAHGIISPLLFAVAGSFKHHYHTLEIGSMRGIAHHSPWLAGHMMIGWMGSLGLPLMAGFVAEVCILIAFWMAFGWWTLLPALTLIITAAYYLWSMQRTIFESGDPHQAILPDTMAGHEPRDVSWHENIGMFVLGISAIIFGILPGIFLGMMSAWSGGLVSEAIVDALTMMGVKP